MTNVLAQPKFSNAQLELLRMFKENLPDEELTKLRRILANFLLDEVFKEAERTAIDSGYSKALYNL